MDNRAEYHLASVGTTWERAARLTGEGWYEILPPGHCLDATSDSGASKSREKFVCECVCVRVPEAGEFV